MTLDGSPSRVDHQAMFPMSLFILISMIVMAGGAVLLLKDARSDPGGEPDPVRRLPDTYR
jgi:hypothetical protein